MRYVTIRRGKDGPRFYWQRKGYKLERLPADELERHKRAKELNDWADQTPPDRSALPADDSVFAGIIAEYRQHHSFLALAPNTRRYYERWLDDIAGALGAVKTEAIDKAMCEEYLASIDSIGARRNARAVLRQALHRAVSLRRLPSNPTSEIRLQGLSARQEFFSDDDLEAFVAGCRDHPYGWLVYRAFVLLLFTGQRPGDVLKMTWGQYNGTTIKARQQKTKTWVEVPAHPQLKEMLDGLPKEGAVILMHNGRSVQHKLFNTRFNQIKRAVGLGSKQARDLRRTAVVRMAEGGAEIQDIAAVTGHTIDRTRQILEVYMPRTGKMAARGVARMANLSLTLSAPDSLTKNLTTGNH